MSMFSRRLLAVVFLATSVVAAMSACSPDREGAGAPEDIVWQRAQAWADALIAKDLDAAYGFTSPNYRAFTAPRQYHARVAGAGNWKKAEVAAVDCEQTACEVRLVVTHYVPQMKMDSTTPLVYRWVELEGSWWVYVPAG